jgi:hypothetical protein
MCKTSPFAREVIFAHIYVDEDYIRIARMRWHKGERVGGTNEAAELPGELAIKFRTQS